MSAPDLTTLPAEAAPPRSNGELVFEKPWHARAFGMATALTEAGFIEWNDFRDHLIEGIRTKGQCGVEEYFERWSEALEAVLIDKGALQEAEISERAEEFEHHERDEIF